MSENGAGRTEKGALPPRPKRGRRSWRGIAHHHTEPAGSVEELAARLAPLEEQKGARAGDTRGAIVVDTGKLKLPEGIGANEAKGAVLFGIEPVVVVIVALLALFILFVAWEISRTTVAGG